MALVGRGGASDLGGFSLGWYPHTHTPCHAWNSSSPFQLLLTPNNMINKLPNSSAQCFTRRSELGKITLDKTFEEREVRASGGSRVTHTHTGVLNNKACICTHEAYPISRLPVLPRSPSGPPA